MGEVDSRQLTVDSGGESLAGSISRRLLVAKLHLATPLSSKLCFVRNRERGPTRRSSGPGFTKQSFAGKCVPKCNLGTRETRRVPLASGATRLAADQSSSGALGEDGQPHTLLRRLIRSRTIVRREIG